MANSLHCACYESRFFAATVEAYGAGVAHCTRLRQSTSAANVGAWHVPKPGTPRIDRIQDDGIGAYIEVCIDGCGNKSR